jgi:hypothetical protein
VVAAKSRDRVDLTAGTGPARWCAQCKKAFISIPEGSES